VLTGSGSTGLGIRADSQPPILRPPGDVEAIGRARAAGKAETAELRPGGANRVK
jgi:hypothetical protein